MGGCESADDCSLREIIVGSVVSSSCALPGMFLGIALLRPLGCRLLNMFGFAMLAMLFLIFGVTYIIDMPDPKVARLVMLCLVTTMLYSANCVATYVYPTITFPAEVRSCASGICGMGGKAGALVGAFAFSPVEQLLGKSSVFIFQAILCIGGFCLCAALQKAHPSSCQDSLLVDQAEPYSVSLPIAAGA